MPKMQDVYSADILTICFGVHSMELTLQRKTGMEILL